MAGFKRLPKGWNQESVKKLWRSLGGEEGGVNEVIKRLRESKKVKIQDPEAFAAALADMVRGTTKWRGKKKNPLSSDQLKTAVKVYTDFFGRPPKTLQVAKWKKKPSFLVSLGDAVAVEYRAKKADDESPTIYRHEFSEDYLWYDPDNNILMIYGPELAVTEAGIEN